MTQADNRISFTGKCRKVGVLLGEVVVGWRVFGCGVWCITVHVLMCILHDGNILFVILVAYEHICWKRKEIINIMKENSLTS